MKKRKFTFAMLTYNQEKYVVEQLESIKYQVLNYGNDFQVYFLLCDDASSDSTVRIAKKWVEKEKIFDDCNFIVSLKNKGLVNNYIIALKNIKTDLFKLLGGDDLYYKNNVFEAVLLGDFVISPTIKLNSSNIYCETKWMFKRYLMNRLYLKDLLKKELKYDLTFETPGVFWDHKFAGKQLYCELKQYKWCEDLPCWNYLLNIENLHVEISEKPYVFYRVNSGISTNINHERNEKFENEVEIIRKKIFINRYKYPIKCNPHRYMRALTRLVYNYIIFKIDKRIITFEHDISEEVREATHFYKDIYDKSDKWLKENWQEIVEP